MKEPGRYHHGHLREALIVAAKQLLAEHGQHDFSLADAARLAGVSVAAPYRHFADREALLRGVAAAGFSAFAADLREASRSGKPAFCILKAMCDAYLRFAREEPGFYIAMFSMHAPEGSNAYVAGAAAFDVLLDAVAAVLDKTGPERDAVRGLALQAWSLSHGVATLAAAGHLGRDPATAEAILRSGVMALIENRSAGASPKNFGEALPKADTVPQISV